MEKQITSEMIEQYKKQMEEMRNRRISPQTQNQPTDLTNAIDQENIRNDKLTSSNKWIWDQKENNANNDMAIHPFRMGDNVLEVNSNVGNISSENPQDNSNEEEYLMKSDITPKEEYEKFAKLYPARGKLQIQAFTARRNIPIPNATIEVSKSFPSGKYVIATLKTDISGQTSIIELPAKNKAESEVPDQKDPYTTYDIKATHLNFAEVRSNDVPVFEGIMSLQKIDFVPPGVTPRN